MDKDLFSIFEDNKNVMSKSHRQIADFIANHYEKAAYMTAQKLGNAVGVSESTVVRFACALGFGGYPDLQKKLRKQLQNKLTSVQRIEVTNDILDGEDILKRVLMSDIEKIRLTLEETSEADFLSAAAAIENSRNIYILGARSAEPLAKFLNYYLSLMFPDVRQVRNTTTSELYEQLMRIGEGDVIIGISFPRYSRQTAKMLEFAKKNGAHVTAITDSDASPIAPFADDLLIARSDMNSFADSLVAPLSLINALIAALSISSEEKVRKSLERLEKIWDELEVYSGGEKEEINKQESMG